METAATLQNWVSTPQPMTHHSLETLSSRILKVRSNSNRLWSAALKLAEEEGEVYEVLIFTYQTVYLYKEWQIASI